MAEKVIHKPVINKDGKRVILPVEEANKVADERLRQLAKAQSSVAKSPEQVARESSEEGDS